MIIGIEGYQTEALLFGRTCCKKVLCQRVKEVLQLYPMDNEAFITIFCRRYGFECVAYDEGVKPDYVIDLDTCKVFGGSCARAELLWRTK